MKASLFPLLVTLMWGHISATAAVFPHAKSADNSGYIINDVQLIDGTGEQAKLASVIVKGKKIEHIAWGKKHLPSQNNLLSINGKGRVLAPGFIDLHSHGNPLTHGQFDNFIAMGVTSISLGQDGFSGFISDFEQWRQKLKLKGTGVNIIPFIGHGSLRVMAGTGQKSIPSERELVWMANKLNQLLPHTFGMSTGLEYNPALFAKSEELITLAKVVGGNKRIIMSHLRNEDDDKLFDAIDELAEQGKYAKVHISHLKSVYGKGAQRAKEIIDYIGQYEMTADMYPYTASYTGIALLFPKWAKTQQQINQITPSQRQALLEHLNRRVLGRNGPEATLLGSGEYAGLTLKQVADKLHKPFAQVLLDDIGPQGASAAYFIMDEQLQRGLLAAPWLAISSDGSPTMFHPRGYGSFAKAIAEYVNRLDILSLPNAIHKMSGLPAAIIGLENRGVVKVGAYADLVLFDPKNVQANATFSQPHQLAKGIDLVWVNGEIVKDGEQISGKPGELLSPSFR